MGKPPEHIKKALEDFIEDLGKQETIEVSNKKIHEPKKIDKEGVDLYTTFAEVEVLSDDLISLFYVVLNHLPSNVEILKPSELNMKNFEASEILSQLAVKLHNYDEVAKVLSFERNNLQERIKKLENRIKELESIKEIESKDE